MYLELPSEIHETEPLLIACPNCDEFTAVCGSKRICTNLRYGPPMPEDDREYRWEHTNACHVIKSLKEENKRIKRRNEMRDDLAEIICIVDRSGSMGPLTDDVIGGINRFIDDQRAVDGEANFSLILFDNEVETVYDSVDINTVEHLTRESYVVRGMTAMNDAIGQAVTKMGKKLSIMDESERPAKVIVAIMTDGHENASKEFTNKTVKEMVDHQTDKYSWEFIFMAANIDVDEAADQIGIRSANRMSFAATAKGVDTAYCDLSAVTRSYRSN